MIDIYGIPNCDTVKKARKWLQEKGVDHAFHDFRKEGVPVGALESWADSLGFEALLNRRGTTFRQLADADRQDIDRGKAIALMAAHPTLIKRPVVEHPGGVLAGFGEDQWTRALL